MYAVSPTGFTKLRATPILSLYITLAGIFFSSSIRMNPPTLWLTIKGEIRVVCRTYLALRKRLGSSTQGSYSSCFRAARDLFVRFFFSFRVRFIAIWLVIRDGLWSLGSLIVIPYIGWKTVDYGGMTRMLLLGKHYQKFESFRSSCDTFIPDRFIENLQSMLGGIRLPKQIGPFIREMWADRLCCFL